MTTANNSRPLVIYHANCADGFGAAWCFHHKYGAGNVDFYPGVYNEPPPDVTGRDVYLVDFSYPRVVVEEMLGSCTSLTFIDHHKSAVQDLDGIDSAKYAAYTSMDHSGAMLAWKYLFGEQPAPQLIEHIEDRDLWRFAYKTTRNVQAAVFSFPYDFAVWDDLMKTPISELYEAGVAIERKHHKDIAELLAVCTHEQAIGHDIVPCANLPYTMASDACHALLEQYPDAPYAATYYETGDKVKYSLRGRGDFDVSEVAKKFGGGGHRDSAGFSVPRTKLQWD